MTSADLWAFAIDELYGPSPRIDLVMWKSGRRAFTARVPAADALHVAAGLRVLADRIEQLMHDHEQRPHRRAAATRAL